MPKQEHYIFQYVTLILALKRIDEKVELAAIGGELAAKRHYGIKEDSKRRRLFPRSVFLMSDVIQFVI